MSIEIKRRAELYLCGRLATAVPAHAFIPYKGGGYETAESEIEPPFTIVGINEADKVHPLQPVFQCQGSLQIVSHSAEATSVQHAALVRSIYEALEAIVTGQRDDVDFTFHGIDITSTESASDEENEVWADIIRFNTGMGFYG